MARTNPIQSRLNTSSVILILSFFILIVSLYSFPINSFALIAILSLKLSSLKFKKNKIIVNIIKKIFLYFFPKINYL